MKKNTWVSAAMATAITAVSLSAAPLSVAQTTTTPESSLSQSVSSSSSEAPSTSSTSTTQKNTVSPVPTQSESSVKASVSAVSATAQPSSTSTKVTIKLSYKGLEANKKYTAAVTLVDSKGNMVMQGQPVMFTTSGESGVVDITLENVNKDFTSGHASLDVIDGSSKVASLSQPVKVATVGDSDNKTGNAQIKTSASMDTDAIQTGAKISDTIRYDGLVPGVEYKVETRLMCTETSKDTGASATNTFTPSAVAGEYTVKDVEVKDPDCMKQVVFEKVMESKTGKLVATHEDFEDSAQIVGDGFTSKKKKKKTPTPVAPAKSATPQAPALMPQGKGGAGMPHRATIGNVPSGEFDASGSTIFGR